MKQIRVLFLVVILVGVLLGCANSKAVVSKESLRGKQDPLNYSGLDLDWMTVLHKQQPPSDVIIKKIERVTNTKINIIWVPDAIQADRLNAALASGKLPEIVTITDIKASSVLNSLKSGMFWEVGPYLDEYPNLRNMNDTILNNISVEGKIYGIYRERPLSRQGVVIRKDWLQNLSLPMPDTVDDLYNIGKAFTYNDPDQNGKHDTIGFTDRNDLTYGVFKTLASYMGTPNEWGERSGLLIPDFETEEYMNTMKFMKKLYDEKLINHNFTITSKDQQQELFIKGQAGIYIGNMVDAIDMRNKAIKLNPNAKIDITNRIKGPDGKEHVWAVGGHGGMFAIPKASVKTEEKLKKVLAFLDRMAESDIATLMEIGIEGVHYRKLEDGTFEIIEENKGLLARDVKPYHALKSLNTSSYTNQSDPMRVKFDKLTEDNENFLVTNPAEALFSPMFTEQGSELRKIIDGATFKFILGELDEEGFKQEIEKWRKNGGYQIIKELNEEYKR
ncbi:extracellular solute-binding protein [Metabacillus arenae]|uniref:Extracellular solute-binding protein n=1 Tax=Metabacillus arenae TaxID=2771434 RepID=A0A926NKA1_9BACI|nr:extracellular solute-binding protein [Metabacillus arenae]MBD1379401.1 extracellular solute-binding protein [Metabacillus arenae]